MIPSKREFAQEKRRPSRAMIILLYNLPILAQAKENTPSLLDGYVEVPFAWIGAVVGVPITYALGSRRALLAAMFSYCFYTGSYVGATFDPDSAEAYDGLQV